MLKQLQNNSGQYVTKEELDNLLNQVLEIEKMQGLPGRDAKISPMLISQILNLATPIHGVHYRDGVDGEDGKTIIVEEPISGDQIIQRIEEAETKLRVPFSAVEGSGKLLNKINEMVHAQNDLSQFSSNAYDEYIQLRDKIQGIEILVSRPCPDEVEPTLHACETFNPTLQGEADGYIDGSTWYNTVDERYFTRMCGQWLEIALVTPCRYITEQGDAICTEQGDDLCVEQGCE